MPKTMFLFPFKYMILNVLFCILRLSYDYRGFMTLFMMQGIRLLPKLDIHSAQRTVTMTCTANIVLKCSRGPGGIIRVTLPT